jgi:hypothetical protein
MPQVFWTLIVALLLSLGGYNLATTWIRAQPEGDKAWKEEGKTPSAQVLPQTRYNVIKELHRTDGGDVLLARVHAQSAVLEQNGEEGLIERLQKSVLFIQNPSFRNSKGQMIYPLYVVRSEKALWQASTSLFTGMEVQITLYHLDKGEIPETIPKIQPEWRSQSKEMLIDLKEPTQWQVYAKQLKANFFSLLSKEESVAREDAVKGSGDLLLQK